MVYLIVFILLFLLLVVTSCLPLNKQSKQITYMFSFFVLLFFAGFRYETGHDWINYLEVFRSVPTLGHLWHSYLENAGTEPGFTLLNSIVKTFGGGIQVVYFVVAFISLYFFYKAIAQFSSNRMLSVLLFFCLAYLFLIFSIIRQGLAVSICFFALRFILERKMWKYFLCVALAMMFHYTAVIMLPLYFILNKRIPQQLFYILTGLGIALAFFEIVWLSPVLLFLSQVFPNPWLVEKVHLYLTETIIRNIGVMSFVNAGLLILFTVYRNRGEKKFKYYNIFLNIFALYLFSNIFLYEVLELSLRLSYYFIIGFLILPTFFISLQTRKNNKVLITALFCFLAFYNERSVFLESPREIIYNPYQNYLIYRLRGKPSSAEDRLNRFLEFYHHQ